VLNGPAVGCPAFVGPFYPRQCGQVSLCNPSCCNPHSSPIVAQGLGRTVEGEIMVKIFVGNSIEILPTLPAESVHCVVTSPPYWSLRDYSLPLTVWGGDPTCAHVWGPEMTQHQRGQVGEHSTLEGGPQAGGNGRLRQARQGQFCQRCGAWCGCLGLEPTPDLYVAHLVEVFREVRRVLRGDGTCWVNLGDSYASSPQIDNYADPKASRRTPDGRCRTASVKPKDLVGIPWRVAFALQADGWWLRSAVVWHKPNCMPESVTDRPTNDYEFVFLLAKSERYFYDSAAIAEGAKQPNGKAELTGQHKRGQLQNLSGSTLGTNQGAATRNRRAVWTIPTTGFKGAHFAVFPPALVEPCVKSGTSERGACPKCGAPWERIIKSTGHKNNREPAHVPGNSDTKTDSTGWQPTTVDTDDWQPTCNCAAGDPIPCTVLDPFGGAGTTALQADRLQRDAILIELNPDYAEMARQRIKADGGMFTTVEIEEQHVPTT